MVIILMGVSGSGKTTVGQLLARELDWPFYDADEFHPPANIAKMAQGQPLNDDDRAPWLAALHRQIHRLLAEQQSAVVTCSALRQTYREQLLRDNPGARLVYLKGEAGTIARRMADRPGHFMKPEMLASQFATLEAPRDALAVEVTQPPAVMVNLIKNELKL